jgi:hypothetical protein
MDMSKQELNVAQMQEWIQQLKKLDELILLHQQHGGEAADFMVSQYTFSKEQLLKHFVSELVQHNFENQLHAQMVLLQKLLGRFLSEKPGALSSTGAESIRQLEQLLIQE